jgi:hypothetical protein
MIVYKTVQLMNSTKETDKLLLLYNRREQTEIDC